MAILDSTKYTLVRTRESKYMRRVSPAALGDEAITAAILSGQYRESLLSAQTGEVYVVIYYTEENLQHVDLACFSHDFRTPFCLRINLNDRPIRLDNM